MARVVWHHSDWHQELIQLQRWQESDASVSSGGFGRLSQYLKRCTMQTGMLLLILWQFESTPVGVMHLLEYESLSPRLWTKHWLEVKHVVDSPWLLFWQSAIKALRFCSAFKLNLDFSLLSLILVQRCCLWDQKNSTIWKSFHWTVKTTEYNDH